MFKVKIQKAKYLNEKQMDINNRVFTQSKKKPSINRFKFIILYFTIIRHVVFFFESLFYFDQITRLLYTGELYKKVIKRPQNRLPSLNMHTFPKHFYSQFTFKDLLHSSENNISNDSCIRQSSFFLKVCHCQYSSWINLLKLCILKLNWVNAIYQFSTQAPHKLPS